MHLVAAYAFTSPKAFRKIDDALVELERAYPSLRRPFALSLWPAITFNLGMSIWTRLHRDFHNLIYSMCAIHALGNYDHKKGGHLILWEWKLVIEFPPGTVILIPSAAVAHGNIAVQPGETRKSFTQYCPGGLMRFFEYGHRTAEQFEAEDPEGWAAMNGSDAERWEEACSMFSKAEELREDCIENLRLVDLEQLNRTIRIP